MTVVEPFQLLNDQNGTPVAVTEPVGVPSASVETKGRKSPPEPRAGEETPQFDASVTVPPEIVSPATVSWPDALAIVIPPGNDTDAEVIVAVALAAHVGFTEPFTVAAVMTICSCAPFSVAVCEFASC